MARSKSSDSSSLKMHIIGLVALVALIVSAYSLFQISKLNQVVFPETVEISEFLDKLTAHEQMSAFQGVVPLNIIQINQNNVGNLQSQIAGLDTTYLGDFLVQYDNAIVIYDFDKDELKGNLNLQTPQQLPEDFFTKLYSHNELAGVQDEQPIGGPLDAQSLATLQEQFPEIYANAKVGDFLLRYESRLVIFDYNNNQIINSVQLG